MINTRLNDYQNTNSLFLKFQIRCFPVRVRSISPAWFLNFKLLRFGKATRRSSRNQRGERHDGREQPDPADERAPGGGTDTQPSTRHKRAAINEKHARVLQWDKPRWDKNNLTFISQQSPENYARRASPRWTNFYARTFGDVGLKMLPWTCIIVTFNCSFGARTCDLISFTGFFFLSRKWTNRTPWHTRTSLFICIFGGRYLDCLLHYMLI